MSKQLAEIDSDLAAWIAQQKIFFVGTAPLSTDAHINISPKGGDSFRVLGRMKVAYQDYTGSGAETAAHVRENGRIIIMFCAFDGPPRIVRLHGRARIITGADPLFQSLEQQFPQHPGTRAFVHAQLDRVSSSCGFAVPFFDFRENRDALDKWSNNQTAEKIRAYRAKKNRASIDGLSAFPELGI